MATSELISQIIDPTLIPNKDTSANWQPNGEWTKERISVHDFYKSQERIRIIAEFVHQRSLIPEVVRENGITILILSQKEVTV